VIRFLEFEVGGSIKQPNHIFFSKTLVKLCISSVRSLICQAHNFVFSCGKEPLGSAALPLALTYFLSGDFLLGNACLGAVPTEQEGKPILPGFLPESGIHLITPD
jgi:Fe-S-cluster containining protein